jgi:hypothetical protein
MGRFRRPREGRDNNRAIREIEEWWFAGAVEVPSELSKRRQSSGK